jgi:hypothetical protein
MLLIFIMGMLEGFEAQSVFVRSMMNRRMKVEWVTLKVNTGVQKTVLVASG